MITNTELEYKGNLYPSKIIKINKEVDKISFYTDNNVILQLTVLRDSVLRFRYAVEGGFEPDFSYALADEATYGFNHLEVKEHEQYYAVKTSKLQVKISRKDLRIAIYDSDGNVINEDEQGFHWEESYEFGGSIVKMSKLSQEAESFYGMGDKPTQLNPVGLSPIP